MHSPLEEILSRLGFTEDMFSEVIAVVGDSSRYRVSPLGLWRRGGLLYARIYGNTRLSRHVIEHGREACICVTQDPLVFYRAVTGGDIVFTRASRVSVPCIAGCDAVIEGAIGVASAGEDGVVIEVRPLHVVAPPRTPRAFNRAAPAIIEALVYYTKIPYLGGGVEEAVQRIMYCRDTVYRATRNPVYRRVIDDIARRAIELARAGGK